MKSKILIGCPVHESKLYCLENWLINTLCFYGHFDLFVADNSIGNKAQDLLKRYSVKSCKINPDNKTIFQTLAESHDAVRKYAVDNNYDYLLHLECDIFPPQTIIYDLMRHKKDVVSAMYMIYEREKRHILIQELDEFDDGTKILNYRIRDSFDDLEWIDGSLKKIQACGLGCTMISKKVFQKINFRCDPTYQVFPDSIFYNDLFHNKIEAFLDTAILCDHQNHQWNLVKL